MVNSLSSGNRDTESGSSSNHQENNSATTAFKTKITKKDCRSAYNLKESEDLSPQTSSDFFERKTTDKRKFLKILVSNLTFMESLVEL